MGWRLAVWLLVLGTACTRREAGVVAAGGGALSVLPGFQDQLVVSGLEQPTAVRFARDGRIFIAEKSGLVKVFDPNRDARPNVFADLRTNVYNYWDRGLLDLELHPNFPDTPYVYVLYSHDAAVGGKAPHWGTPGGTSDSCPTPPGASGCVISGRLSRLEAGDGGMRGLEQVLIENWPSQFPSHSVGTLQFGPDGMLYVSGGDGASFDFVDYGQVGDPVNLLADPPGAAGVPQVPPAARGGALRSQNLAVPGFPARWNGKVLRVDPDTGAAAPGNPLSDDAAPVVAYGFRNPFRMTFRPGTQELWIGDVGWGDWEEIDRLIDPLASPVANFGWPCFEGAGRQPGYEAAGLALCDALYARNDQRAPYFAYSHSAPLLLGDGCDGFGQGSVTGLAFYSEGLYPEAYRGALFIADYSRNCIWSMFAGADGLPDPATRQVFVHAAPQPVQLLIGPGNDLYYTSIAGGLHRVAALGENRPPVASFEATPSSGAVPLTAAFDATGSSDPDPGDTLTFAWDLDGDGEFDDASGPSADFVYTTSGAREVGLRVTDSRGAQAGATRSISAGDASGGLAASIDVLMPLEFAVGDRVEFRGTATDGTQPLAASHLQWDLVVQHCPTPDHCHPHVLESFRGAASGSFVAPEHDYPYYLQLILRASADDGRQSTAVARLDPRTVELSLSSAPPGLALALNQTVAPAPFQETVVIGSQNTVSAPAYAGYEFTGWSDGGAAAHLLRASTDVQLTATYRMSPEPGPLKALGMPVARVSSPLGGGNPSLEVVRDSDYPPPGTNDPLRQYDTVTADPGPKQEWVGYEFPVSYAFSALRFQEGQNFSDGGWFERIGVRVRSDGAFRDVRGLLVTPLYPGTGDAVGYRSYRLEFEASPGDAIQLYGPAGGSAHFVSIAELDVYGWRAVAGPTVARVRTPPLSLPGERVELDARSSFDPAARDITYHWTQTAGPAVSLEGGDTARPSFVAPESSEPTTLRFTLEVQSGTDAKVTTSVDVPITPLTAPVDISSRGVPIVSEPKPVGAGAKTLELIRDGFEPAAGSTDSAPEFATWTGDPGVIEGWVGYEFAAPQRIGKLRFQEGAEYFDGGWFETLAIEVRQRGRWIPLSGVVSTPAYPARSDAVGFQVYEFTFTPVLADGVRIFGLPGGSARFFSVAELRAFAVAPPEADAPPFANAGDDATVPSGLRVSLDGTRSIDPEAAPLRYDWQQTAGTLVQLSNRGYATPSFTTPTAPRETKLTFSLTVDDGTHDSAPDTVTFTVQPSRGPVDLTPLGVPIAGLRMPFVAGNHNLETMRDGVSPPLDATDALLEYDTFLATLCNDGWVGYQLPELRAFGRLVFQEGLHFVDGGWFDALHVEVRRGGVWSEVSGLTITPNYPGYNDGQSWQSYDLRFTPVLGEAIRLRGRPGGAWTFFSVAELRAYTPR
ncbi:MAG TPA: PQQ-dependent sugar dehydrogenase [Polyangiales bacterium]|nr:PQQ-dependent sugar dehydrogenase [Polyangiales bacterium]